MLLPVVTNDFVRGAVSGLGIVNLGAAFAELVPMFVNRERRDPVMPDASDPEYPQ